MAEEIEYRIREVVDRCDVCVVDLDQCIYPRFAQTTLGRLLLLRSLRSRHWRFLPRFCAGAGYIGYTRAGQLFGRHPTNYELMTAFCRVIRGIPLQLAEDCANRLPEIGPRTWRAALGKIADGMSVYLLTFSIDPVAGAYGRVQDHRGRPIFLGWRGTPLEVDGGVITGAGFSDYSLSPAAKREALEEIMEEAGFHRPLIIGHGEDEAMMAVLARKAGGGSIGFLKPGGAIDDFDLRLPGDAWKLIAAAL